MNICDPTPGDDGPDLFNTMADGRAEDLHEAAERNETARLEALRAEKAHRGESRHAGS